MDKSTCSVSGCEQYVRCKGFCTRHYRRLLAGVPMLLPCETCGADKKGNSKYCSSACFPENHGKPCLVDDCPRKVVARGLCATHHASYSRGGTLPDRWCRGCGSALPVEASQRRRYCGDQCKPKAGVFPASWKPCERCSYPIDMAPHPSGRKRRSDVKMCKFCTKAKYRRHRQSLGEIVLRDGRRCRLCGDVVNLDLESPNPASPSVDHIVPFSLGGTHDLENLQLSHLRCNQAKNNKI